MSSLALHIRHKLHDTSHQPGDTDLLKHVRPEGFKTRDGISVKPGDTVELEGGNFLRVKEVLHNTFYDRYWIVGWRFVRNKETLGLPKKDSNEVYWVVHLWEYNLWPAIEQSLVRVDESQILRKRTMNLVSMTNPVHQKGNGADLRARGHGAFHCRWKHVILTKTGRLDRPLDAFQIPAAKIKEASFQRLRAEDCDDMYKNRAVDETLRRSCLVGIQERSAIESAESKSLRSAVEALSLNDNSRHERVPAAYTFADVCCGGGGASRGAEMAGLQYCDTRTDVGLDELGPRKRKTPRTLEQVDLTLHIQRLQCRLGQRRPCRTGLAPTTKTSHYDRFLVRKHQPHCPTLKLSTSKLTR